MTACPACGSTDLEVFLRRAGVPVNSCLLLEDEQAARDFPRGDIELALCRSCAFVHNQAFDPLLATYSPDYEETQGFSEHFQAFIAGLARAWVDRYDLVGRRVVEIGCGKGEFMVQLLDAGVAGGVGVDPGLHPERLPRRVRGRFEAVQGFFPEDFPVLDVDAVVCRHTLEHIAPVGDWMREVRRAIGPRSDTVVLFELPDVERVLQEGAFWDVYYEHCSYFGAGSLARLFRASGFDVVDLRRAYDDQYLLVEARLADGAPPTPPGASERDHARLGEAARRYATTERALADRWRDRLTSVAASGGRSVIWGSGSKGVAFLSAVGEAADAVAAAVDINPFKHGRYMAGTGHRIVAPGELVELRPDLVVVMNEVYLPEISAEIAGLGLSPRVEAL